MEVAVRENCLSSFKDCKINVIYNPLAPEHGGIAGKEGAREDGQQCWLERAAKAMKYEQKARQPCLLLAQSNGVYEMLAARVLALDISVNFPKALSPMKL